MAIAAGIRVGDRVSFDWFGKWTAGHVESIDGVHASVWNGLHGTNYEVHLDDLRPNPLTSARHATAVSDQSSGQ